MDKSFEQVIAENQGRIRYIASRYCQANDFNDLYQEILMQLWRSFNSFKGNSSRETWLYKVALNTACSFVKKSIKRKELEQSLSTLIRPEWQSGQDRCQADILNNFMNSLNTTDASLLMMYLDGFTSEKSADVVGISGNAVRLRMKRIKNLFENQYIGEKS